MRVIVLALALMFASGCYIEPTRGCKCSVSTDRFDSSETCRCHNCECRQNYKCCMNCRCVLSGKLTKAQREEALKRIQIEVERIENSTVD